jgi:hypothetical protein
METMLMSKTYSRLAAGSLAFLLAAACSEPLQPEDLVGTYQATEFRVVLNGVTTDLLTKGASVTLELESGGTTSGRFVLPVVAGVQITPVDDDLDGTYDLQNGVVRLEQAADTYLKDFLFVAADGQLRASQVIQSPTVTGNLRLVLTRE